MSRQIINNSANLVNIPASKKVQTTSGTKYTIPEYDSEISKDKVSMYYGTETDIKNILRLLAKVESKTQVTVTWINTETISGASTIDAFSLVKSTITINSSGESFNHVFCKNLNNI